MENPFESGHIKNYILAYVSVVVIMILFFIATTLFHETKVLEKKVFVQKELPKKQQQTNQEPKREDFGITVMQKSAY